MPEGLEGYNAQAAAEDAFKARERKLEEAEELGLSGKDKAAYVKEETEKFDRLAMEASQELDARKALAKQSAETSAEEESGEDVAIENIRPDSPGVKKTKSIPPWTPQSKRSPHQTTKSL